MTPEEFVAKWKASTLTERAASQSQFLDLCKVLGEPSPSEMDPSGATYAFEKGASKATGASGWADVWKQGFFAWEYKGKGKDLDAAFAQLQQYSGALGNPPLLVVSDMSRFRVTTAWTNTVSKTYELTLDDLLDPAKRQVLKWVLSDPEKLKPGQTRQALTEDAAQKFAVLARRLRERGYDPHRVAHFVNRLVFCMFAEDADLLPNKMFQRMVEASIPDPGRFESMARKLFDAMKSGGLVGFESVQWFNGGLFDDDDALPLDKEDLKQVLAASELVWTEIDPSILGTLFERGLDPDKRSQLGAHYTDRDKILHIIEPVVVRPLLAEWAAVRPEIEEILIKADEAARKAATTRAGAKAAVFTRQRNNLKATAESKFRTFLERLRAFRVLDPACGSGNFLYLSLLALKDIEHRVSVEGEALGLDRQFPEIGPECVLGIEINPYAAELARVSVWIGEIQWMKRNGFGVRTNPILTNLDTIQNRDAILNPDGSEVDWPTADVVVGNPPFLGGKLLRSLLGDSYVEQLFRAYEGRVPAEADLVCYWFTKAFEQLFAGRLSRAGLVATNSIRGGANRRILDSIAREGIIFDASADEPWVVDGASVRVSLVAFAKSAGGLPVHLNGKPVLRVNADLTASAADLTAAVKLPENAGVAFMGDTKGGAFDVSGEQARQWLVLPVNPNGRPNSDVLKPWINGMDLTRRPADKWIIDFGWSMDEASAALYEAPFGYALAAVKPEREKNRRDLYRLNWWRHVEPRPGMWQALSGVTRYIATARVSKFRLFSWCHSKVVPDSAAIVVARDDDTTFGILHSRFHEIWALRLGSSLEDRPRYTPSTTFETFPFPDELTPNLPSSSFAKNPRALAIAAAAKTLDELRRNWLNPPDLVDVVSEVVPGYPERVLPKNDNAEKVLRNRTLTNLYNERPTWLDNAHRDLDAAVASAYGWPVDISDDDALVALLALNQERVLV
ncbi:class I SAM-dependent DNA methyltransferase [Parvibaculum sp.]|uniref:class I SAM-dependent DNA methyltransferase n=1 Tax=Parvibaculum sp. TaxID=2024848 RepID=UPI001DB51B4D|nr:class I SAM-dependent DNA methyltransferase [Parvibaculum sp.]MBX3491009.1 class I SAM-dependent DNA methyltransferase [Parvibaculum sp.]